MNETKDDLKREKVRIVPISNIEDFPDHPFQVKDDESMDALVESIRMNGVLNPVIALKIDENHYQLISGHRRKRACMLLGIDRIPLIGREMTKEEAVIEMVDSNLQREHILPSEKAKAYKMKYEALKRKAGKVAYGIIDKIHSFDDLADSLHLTVARQKQYDELKKKKKEK